MSGPIVFDTEGHAIGEERGHGMTPERFIRLAGWAGFGEHDPVSITADIPAFRELVRSSDVVAGSNIIAHDLPRLGLSRDEILDMARAKRLLDSWTWAPLIDQPESYTDVRRPDVRVFINDSDGRPNMGRLKSLYRLDNLAYRYGHQGKLHDLKQLAKAKGRDSLGHILPGPDGAPGCCDFGAIPLDDPDYLEYLEGDVVASRLVLRTLAAGMESNPGWMDYVWREHRVAAIACVVRENGFRLNVSLAEQRAREGRERSQAHLDRLAAKYGLEMTRKDGKPSAKPLQTEGGKLMLSKALTEWGLTEWDLPDRTAKGRPSYGGKSFLALAEEHPECEGLTELAESVATITGERAVYQTALDHLWPDGLSHPEIFLLQRSGRWSTTAPGLTVFGKRGGRVIERAVYEPDVKPDEVEDIRDAHVLVSFDAAQIDARAVAVHAQDPAYLDLFAPGRDSHTEIAVAIWNDATRREDGKPMHHGFNYGLGPKKMARTAKVSLELAEEFHAGMRARFPGLIAWQEWVRQSGLDDLGVDNGFGRWMTVDPNRYYTQAPALVGQGCARDLMMEGLLKLPNDIIKMIKAQIHDEIVLSIPIRHAREVAEIVKRTMSFEWAPPWCSRPIQIEIDGGKFAYTWEGCYAK